MNTQTKTDLWEHVIPEDTTIVRPTSTAIVVPEGKTLTFLNNDMHAGITDSAAMTHYVTVHCYKGGKVVIMPGNIVERVIVFGGELLIYEAAKINSLIVYGGYVNCLGVLHRCWAVNPGRLTDLFTVEDKSVYDEQSEMVFRSGSYTSSLCNTTARIACMTHSHIAYYEQTDAKAQMHLEDESVIDDGAFYDGALVLHNGADEPRIFRNVEITKSTKRLTGNRGELYEQA